MKAIMVGIAAFAVLVTGTVTIDFIFTRNQDAIREDIAHRIAVEPELPIMKKIVEGHTYPDIYLFEFEGRRFLTKSRGGILELK